MVQYISINDPSKETDQEQGPHSVIHEHDRCCQEHEPAEGFVTERLEYIILNTRCKVVSRSNSPSLRER